MERSRENTTCSWGTCDRPAKGYCSDHHAEYMREWRAERKARRDLIFELAREHVEHLCGGQPMTDAQIEEYLAYALEQRNHATTKEDQQ